ncbi:hypothetical protein P8605_06780 [Streptomyces sp. T-3]|nr:hypothetical protein [Streptomyces sp. T-3]
MLSAETAERWARRALRLHPVGAPKWALLHIGYVVVSAGLMWLIPVLALSSWLTFPLLVVLPLVMLVFPVLAIPGVPKNAVKGQGIWQLGIALVAMVGFLLAVSMAGNHQALAQRGRWADAVVVEQRLGKTDKCELRHQDGRPITPDLRGRDCSRAVEGEVLRVFYDPEGGANPVTSKKSGPPLVLFPALAAVIIGLGAWGSTRVSRCGRRYWTD